MKTGNVKNNKATSLQHQVKRPVHNMTKRGMYIRGKTQKKNKFKSTLESNRPANSLANQLFQLLALGGFSKLGITGFLKSNLKDQGLAKHLGEKFSSPPPFKAKAKQSTNMPLIDSHLVELLSLGRY